MNPTVRMICPHTVTRRVTQTTKTRAKPTSAFTRSSAVAIVAFSYPGLWICVHPFSNSTSRRSAAFASRGAKSKQFDRGPQQIVLLFWLDEHAEFLARGMPVDSGGNDLNAKLFPALDAPQNTQDARHTAISAVCPTGCGRTEVPGPRGAIRLSARRSGCGLDPA